MFRRIFPLLLFSWCVGCDRERQASVAVASSTPVAAGQRIDSATPTAPPLLEPNVTEREASDSISVDPDSPDSSHFDWRFAPRRPDEGNTRFSGRFVRHPSGLLQIWFDTATRATEERPAGIVAVDSVSVTGLRHGEWFTIECNKGAGIRDTQIVGVVRNDNGYLEPRLAWQLDTATTRIKSVPTQGILCTAASEEEVD